MHLVTISDSLIYLLSKKDLELKLIFSEFASTTRIPDWEDLSVRQDFGDLQPLINEFAETFRKNFTEEQTRNMLYLLRRLTVERKEDTIKKFQLKVSMGVYNSYANRITIYSYPGEDLKDELKETIFHELLHMASTRRIRDGFTGDYVTGFELRSNFGKSLNEGYTEYLREKYFGKGNYTELPDWRVVIAKGIEYIVGEKEMEKYFFNADLPGLMAALRKYASQEDLLKLFFLMERVENPTLGISKDKYRVIRKELSKINERKLKRDLEEGRITQEQYDIEHAMKVNELKYGFLWGEKTKVIKEENCFLLEENGFKSMIYSFQQKNNQNNAGIIPKTI